jgi:hypothetical protein
MSLQTNTSLISDKEFSKLRKDIVKEFPHDFALQEVHLSRKILALEAKKIGMDYLQYVRKIASDVK